jgi:hypothetical protein
LLKTDLALHQRKAALLFMDQVLFSVITTLRPSLASIETNFEAELELAHNRSCLKIPPFASKIKMTDLLLDQWLTSV